ATAGSMATRVPRRGPDSITPAASCPSTSGRETEASPISASPHQCRSEPQIPTAVTRTRVSPGPGSGTGSSARRPPPTPACPPAPAPPRAPGPPSRPPAGAAAGFGPAPVAWDTAPPREAVLRPVVPAQFALTFQPAQQHIVAVQLGGEVQQQRRDALEVQTFGGEPAKGLAQPRFERLDLGKPAERRGRALVQRGLEFHQVRSRFYHVVGLGE